MSGKIRINDLARELEIKSRSLLDYLHEIGHEDKKSHSSAIEGDVADKVREHFRHAGQQLEAPKKPVAAPHPLPLPLRLQQR